MSLRTSIICGKNSKHQQFQEFERCWLPPWGVALQFEVSVKEANTGVWWMWQPSFSRTCGTWFKCYSTATNHDEELFVMNEQITVRLNPLRGKLLPTVLKCQGRLGIYDTNLIGKAVHGWDNCNCQSSTLGKMLSSISRCYREISCFKSHYLSWRKYHRPPPQPVSIL